MPFTLVGGHTPRIIRLWPVGLVGRVSVVLLAAVILVFVASAFFYEEAETYIDDDSRITQLAEELSTDLRVLRTTPISQRGLLGALLSDNGISVSWRSANQPIDLEQPHRLRQVEESLISNDRDLEKADIRVWADRADSSSIHGSLQLADGSRLAFNVPGILKHRHMTGGLASAAITAGAVALAAAMIVRALSTPLRALSEVADSIAKSDDLQWSMVDERGPREVRGLARAINKMQHRIRRLINDRTEILAAVSHDLRTPLARLRLRAGFMDDEETQMAIEADIDEMEAMVTGVLAYLAGDLDPEPVKQVDLVAILNTLLDSQSDRGRETSYTGPDRCQAIIRPLAIKRVFANLIDNACNYGGDAHVTLDTDGQTATISVVDDGPGIPEDELENVLSAFYRVEGSRSRATGGMGLGLAIVTREVGRAGGKVDLFNVKGRGLCVRITLPLGAVPV
ncbi:ATP-binding protein [Asaia lannensis]|uniref:histidine kinase n=1 Tax=Asaia lannensis NBRC 102526 TaxID=1307926 RepID=A0ABT1CCQ5_9PROT|nr:ATP-binding protein [Asaia lannensis]MCO6158556.1 ATP-binding protein [Asaia lannensis NBRC 102526]GBR00852.1 two component sensor histidine kinase [Asaia lannensis NBRC 102526]